jgi:ABC-type nitrate/sulfonate/bicarbonate transport system substrate-binding protein
MNPRDRLACMFAAVALCSAASASAQQVVLGVNAGLSTRDTVKAQEAKFAPLAQAASKALRISLQVKPVQSPDVAKELAEKNLDVLIIHTHDALAAVKKKGYTLLAFSQDLKYDRVRILAAEGAAKLADVRGKRVWTTGAYSFATATAMAVLRSQGIAAKDITLKITRYQDAIPFMLQNKFGEFGVTRLDSVALSWEKEGRAIAFTTDRLPVYAVVAKPDTDAALSERLGSWLIGLSQSDETSGLAAAAGFQGFRAAEPTEAERLSLWFGS